MVVIVPSALAMTWRTVFHATVVPLLLAGVAAIEAIGIIAVAVVAAAATVGIEVMERR